MGHAAPQPALATCSALQWLLTSSFPLALAAFFSLASLDSFSVSRTSCLMNPPGMTERSRGGADGGGPRSSSRICLQEQKLGYGNAQPSTAPLQGCWCAQQLSQALFFGHHLACSEATGLLRAAGQAERRTAPHAAEGTAAPARRGMELFAACRAPCCPSPVQHPEMQPCRETRTTDIAQSSKFGLQSDARLEGLGTRQARGRAA